MPFLGNLPNASFQSRPTRQEFSGDGSTTVFTLNQTVRAEDIIVSVVGGEHSVPLGLLMALNEKYSAFGILQIDAHCDLRQSYQGIHQSHASIFHNILQECTNVTKVVQLGVRDFSSQEFEYSI